MEHATTATAPATAGCIRRAGRAGLLSKGILYCLLGGMAFGAALHVNGQSTGNADRSGVLHWLRALPGGPLLLALLAAGLFSYSIWRGFQTFADTEGKGKGKKGWAARLRYFFSGITYASVAFLAARLCFSGGGNGRDSQQALAGQLLNKPLGQVLAFVVAGVFLATGLYQFYYAFRGKYRKHAGAGGARPGGRLLLLAGKIGYCARGAVWLLVGFLFGRAALHARAAEAGDTSRAFGWLQQEHAGSWMLAAIGIGLVCYGLFNFIRARYDRLEGEAN